MRSFCTTEHLPVSKFRINLTARQYEVGMAADGREALAAAARRVPDLILLDLGLGDVGGLDVIASLRGWTKAPILVLSARADSAAQIAAFDAGADDYMTKPFAMEELMARIRALLRRAEERRKVDLAVVVGNHVVDMIAKTVVRAEEATCISRRHVIPADPEGGINRFQYCVEPLRQLILLRNCKPNAAVADLGLGTHQALPHGCG